MPSTDHVRPNKRQLQAAETRGRMLEAARAVFESRGYQATSVGAITKAADTAHGTFYLYFRNKDDAFAEVVSHVLDEMREESRAQLTGDPRADLEGLIRAFLVVFTRHGGLWRALLEGMLLSEEIEAIYVQAMGSFAASISHHLGRLQAAGVARAGFEPGRVATALSDMVVWYAFRELVGVGADGGPADLGEAVETLADLWYHAVYAQP